jgi:DNA-directed RNA polymerase specialized sigma24 family protein
MNRELAALDEEHLEPLVERVLDHDLCAWKELWSALAPAIEATARRRRLTSRLCTREDDRLDIVVRVMGTLEEDGFQRLEGFLACLRQRDGSFRGWLSAVAKNAAVSHTRGHPENVGGKHRFSWVEHAELFEALADGGPDAFHHVAVSEILDYAAHALRPAQLQALCLWVSGEDRAGIASALGVGAQTATRTLRSAVKRLRHHFAPEEGVAENLENIFSDPGDRSPPKGV